jgi:hypothetical protein
VLVPTDGRPQYTLTEAVIRNMDLGRSPMAGASPASPGRYFLEEPKMLARPRPETRDSGSFSPAPVKAPTPKTAARTLWPHLR